MIVPTDSQKVCIQDLFVDGLSAPSRTTVGERNHSRNQYFDDLYNTAYSRISNFRPNYLWSSHLTNSLKKKNSIMQYNVSTLKLNDEPHFKFKNKSPPQIIDSTNLSAPQNTNFDTNLLTVQKCLNNKNRSTIRLPLTTNSISNSLVRYNQSPSIRYSNLAQPQLRRSVAELTKVMFLRPKKFFISNY